MQSYEAAATLNLIDRAFGEVKSLTDFNRKTRRAYILLTGEASRAHVSWPIITNSIPLIGVLVQAVQTAVRWQERSDDKTNKPLPLHFRIDSSL